jgi:hypothetical protein
MHARAFSSVVSFDDRSSGLPRLGAWVAGAMALTATLGLAPRPATAVVRTCGADAVANTANVLCAPPSGPCTPTAVTFSANVEVPTGSCEFDLGGRSLSIQKTLQIAGSAIAKIRNAGAITIGATGKLKARGDFVQPNGYIISGGTIVLDSSAGITVAGTLDVSGDPGGFLAMTAASTITFQGGSSVQANGITTFVFDAQRFADGGTVVVTSKTGSVLLGGDVSATGTQYGLGGDVEADAALNVSVTRQIDASGGGSDGGTIDLAAGDDVSITAPMTVESRGGGGWGGDISIFAGRDELGGAIAGGNVTVDGVALQLNGSSVGGFGGDGGLLDVAARGSIRFQGAGVAIRANAGTQYDADGGDVFLDTGDANLHEIGPLEGDIVVNGLIVATSGGSGGAGGSVGLIAGRQLTINAAIDLSGRGGGGEIDAEAGTAINVNGAITANATAAIGKPGSVDIRAGAAQDASLTVAGNIVANGGAANANSELILLSGCTLAITPGVKIDGHAGAAGGSNVTLISRRPMQLGSASQYLAYGAGVIETVHPAGQNPIIGAGVTFNPARSDVVISESVSSVYPACPGFVP